LLAKLTINQDSLTAKNTNPTLVRLSRADYSHLEFDECSIAVKNKCTYNYLLHPQAYFYHEGYCILANHLHSPSLFFKEQIDINKHEPSAGMAQSHHLTCSCELACNPVGPSHSPNNCKSNKHHYAIIIE